MQRNINKEIRHYQEDVFMGLSLRQLLCSIAAIGAAVGVYYAFIGALGRETVSWVCILAAAPVAAAGFFEYDGLTFEKFLVAVLESEVRGAGPRVWKAENAYHQPKPKKALSHKKKANKANPRKGGQKLEIE